MSRRQTGQAVSLFPFLAVLVSAMGALILLLLVTTRQLHHKAVSRAQAEQALVQSQREAQREAEEAAARHVVPLPLPENHPAFQTDAAEFVIAVPSPAKQLLPPPPPREPDRTREKEQLRQQWESKLAALRENWESLQQRLQEGQRLVSTQAQQEADLAAELARLQGAIHQLQAEKGDLKQEVTTVKTTKTTIAQQVAELQAELGRLKTEKAEQADKFQLVPYLGNSPTRRRPIVIECEAKTVRFASEDIPLSARDVSGFSAEYNPIRAGTEAILAYWEAERQQATSLAAMQPEPYLLFVIRPGGTVSYYVTRRMLEGLPVDSGYELVTQSQELIWPVSTPEAKSACQEAIDAVLGVRNRLVEKTPDGRLPIADELQYEGKDGEFFLQEVQHLRNPERKTFVGGQRIHREERSRSGIPRYKPPTAPERGGFVGPKLEDLKDEYGNMPPRPPSARESLAGQRFVQGRPFPTEPPPRTRSSGSGEAASTAAAGPSVGGAQGPIRKLQPGWKSQHPGTPVDPNRMMAMTPAELDGHLNPPTEVREPIGNYGPAEPDADGRGAGESSGEATSQFGERGEVNDLLSSTTDRSVKPPLKPHAPTNDSGPPPTSNDGPPGGDRTSAVETTDDPTLTGDSVPHGVAGGKGTFSGAGGSSPAAPDSISVQPGGPGGPASSPGLLNSTDEMLARHLPHPLPVPVANSVAAERFVEVRVDSAHIEIGHHDIPIEEGMSPRDLETQFSKELASAAQRWGRPPAGFHWQPALRFHVLPGGNQYYAWLQSASEEWELRNSVEYVFE